jgi:hypothetical protein
VAQQNLWSNSYHKTIGRGRFLPALAVSASLSFGEGSVGEGLQAKNSSGWWMGHNIGIDKIKLATVKMVIEKWKKGLILTFACSQQLLLTVEEMVLQRQVPIMSAGRDFKWPVDGK